MHTDSGKLYTCLGILRLSGDVKERCRGAVEAVRCAAASTTYGDGVAPCQCGRDTSEDVPAWHRHRATPAVGRRGSKKTA